MPSLPSLATGRSPLIQTTIQACLINILANILAQVIEYQKIQKALLDSSNAHDSLEHLATSDVVAGVSSHAGAGGMGKMGGLMSRAGVGGGFEIDKLRVLQFVIWTLISVPPNFRWQQFLERRFPAFYADPVVGLGAKEKGLPLLEVGEVSLIVLREGLRVDC